MTLTETELHQTLDDRGLLEAAQTNEGAYALELTHPRNTVQTIKNEWLALAANQVAPPRDTITPMAAKPRLVYVGAAYNRIYDRLIQHANGHKSATVMQVYPPIDVFDIYPDEREFNVASTVSNDSICVWFDGRTV